MPRNGSLIPKLLSTTEQDVWYYSDAREYSFSDPSIKALCPGHTRAPCTPSSNCAHIHACRAYAQARLEPLYNLECGGEGILHRHIRCIAMVISRSGVLHVRP